MRRLEGRDPLVEGPNVVRNREAALPEGGVEGAKAQGSGDPSRYSAGGTPRGQPARSAQGLAKRVDSRLGDDLVVARLDPRDPDRADAAGRRFRWEARPAAAPAGRGADRKEWRPLFTISSSIRVGRLKATADLALPIAVSTLEDWVPSMRCTRSAWPPSSTTAITTFQPFFAAVASRGRRHELGGFERQDLLRGQGEGHGGLRGGSRAR